MRVSVSSSRAGSIARRRASPAVDARRVGSRRARSASSGVKRRLEDLPERRRVRRTGRLPVEPFLQETVRTVGIDPEVTHGEDLPSRPVIVTAEEVPEGGRRLLAGTAGGATRRGRPD